MKKWITLVLLSSVLVGCKTAAVLPEAKSIHLSLGNPSEARTDTNQADNYLMIKKQYAISYNRGKGHANWVAWELSPDWLGGTDRQDSFRPDPDLPAGWYKPVPSDYTNTGFDRGHLCPSADRSSTEADNLATFLMTNIIPQAPELNREAWARLEDYCRDLVQSGYRLYIMAGTYGQGGEGSRGEQSTLKNRIQVPARNWKVVVVLPQGATREQITAETPVIAVDFPNQTSQVDNQSWYNFLTTPEAIEQRAGVRFFTYLPARVSQPLRRSRFNPDAAPPKRNAQ
ncbi:DNA/RNA non-specific endonuclease [Telluribacter sp.]|jgi:endonuclease G|uniref:DNA/RNA non-specific endonuclease n=1 Tax=Telluribacter sp. TaxID=1978767 RepID=UPI002E0E0BF8|nr:DNA/RNA non-specific endonuclease [Telluribacter sp.]